MTDITDAVLSQVASFTIGLVYRPDGAKSFDVLGSGVFATVDGRRGILTCGHVAEQFDAKSEIGSVFIDAGKQKKFEMQFDLNLIISSSRSFEESEKVFDLAFTLLSPNLATSIEATKGVFLNIDRNRTKMEAFASSRGKYVDVVLGLIGEFSGEPSIEGSDIINNMRACLFTGRTVPADNGLLIFETKDSPDKLPQSFGGLSGGGVWRVYYEGEGDDIRVAEQLLCGIASWERREEKKIACQGWDRIDQALIPYVLKNLPR